MDASNSERFKAKLSTIQLAANVALARLSAQAEFVATLAPGSPAHRTASEVLFLLQDSYFLVMKTLEMLAG